MSVLGFSDKLMMVTERNIDEMSKETCRWLRKSDKTPWYHSLPEKECFLRSREFFHSLRNIYPSLPPYVEIFEYFGNWATKRYHEGVPLEQVIYKLVIMRRQMWVITESKALVMTGLDLHQSVESINKMIRLFDHGTYAVIKKYREMDQAEKDLILQRSGIGGLIRSWVSRKGL